MRLFFGPKMISFNDLPPVDIDSSGIFKYILIEAGEKGAGNKKMLVRGYAFCDYHADILDEVQQTVSSAVKLNCKGGGRIEHDPVRKSIKVYGYSQGFGRADHQEAVGLLKTAFPDYKIAWSNEGY